MTKTNLFAKRNIQSVLFWVVLQIDDRLIIEDYAQEGPQAEIGPVFFHKGEVGLIALVKHEVTQTNLITSPNHNFWLHIVASEEFALESLLIGLWAFLDSVKYLILTIVANAYVENTFTVMLSHLLCFTQ